MAVLTGLNIDESGVIELSLSGEIASGYSLSFCERLTSDVWDYHYRIFPAVKRTDGLYSIDMCATLKALEYESEKVLDLFLVNDSGTQKIHLTTDIDKAVVDANRQVIKMKFGDLICQYYKSGKGGLSVKTKLAVKTDLTVGAPMFEGDLVKLTVSSSFGGPIKLYWGRKSVQGSSRKYDLVSPVCANFEDGKYVLTSESCNMLGGLSSGGGEVWELAADIDGLQLSVRADSSFSSDFLEISDAVKFKFGIDESGSASVFTFENDHRSAPKIKVAVVGSCFARQAFNSLDYFNSDYKRFYECGLTGYHMSFSSMMSPPIQVDYSKLTGEFQPDLNVHGKSHFDKDFVSRLKKYSPDYLIVENYVNISAALIQVGADSFIDENYYLVDTPAFKELKNSRRIRAEGEEHFELYKNKLAEFKSAISEFIADDKIVLVRTQPALYKNDNGEIKEWESSQIIRYRRCLWERYDSYFLSVFPHAKVIDMRDDKYISEKSAHLKFAPSHFGSNYYRDLLNLFNKIVLQHLIRNLGER